MNILLIESDNVEAGSVAQILRNTNFSADRAASGSSGIKMALEARYDIVLVDLNLPDMTGLQFMKEFRATKIGTPVMAVTRDDSIQSKLGFFGRGGDDFVAKPFHIDELIARMKAVIRRTSLAPLNRFREIKINRQSMTVSIKGDDIPLIGREFTILDMLTGRAGSVVSRSEIMDRLYGHGPFPNEKILDVYMVGLRKKIAEASDGDIAIDTIRGRGFALRAADDMRSAG